MAGSKGHYAPLRSDDVPSSSDCEKAPCLTTTSLSPDDAPGPSLSSCLPAGRRSLFIALSISALFNLALLAALDSHLLTAAPRVPTLYSPAQPALRPMVTKFLPAFGATGADAIYAQPPSPAVDAAWRALYYTTLTVTREEAVQLPNKTIPVSAQPDAGYLVGLSVFHDLHCLDSIRKALWADPAAGLRRDTEAAAMHGPMHLMHCIDNLRESLMCHADVAPLSWQWSEANGGVRVFSDVVHQCQDFDAVLTWGREHYYDAGLDTSGWRNGRPPEVGRCGMGECLAGE